MRQFLTITANAFMELVRQPIFLLLLTGSVLFELFLAVPYYFAFGDEPKLVENSVLAVMLLAGLFGAVLSASSWLARGIRSGTALAVLSKPVGRTQFLLAKFTGLALALTILTYVNMVGVLLASRMAFDAYGSTDVTALAIFGGAVAIAYAGAGCSNFFLRRPFVSDAVLGMVVMVTIAAFVIFQFTIQRQSLGTQAQVDWRLIPAGMLILFALWVIAALALEQRRLVPAVLIHDSTTWMLPLACTSVYILQLALRPWLGLPGAAIVVIAYGLGTGHLAMPGCW